MSAADLFGHVPLAPTNPIIGLRVKLNRDFVCHENIAIIGDGVGTHHHALTCDVCGKHRGWLPGAAAKFVRDLTNKFGAPAEPIVLRSHYPAEEPEMSERKFDNTNKGALFKNNDKEGENSPDYRGTINAAGLDYWISAWLKTSAKGTKYMALSIKLKEQDETAKEADKHKAAAELAQDSIPF